MSSVVIFSSTFFRRNQSLLISVVLHSLVLIALLGHFQLTLPQPRPQIEGEIIEATMIDMTDLRKMQQRKNHPSQPESVETPIIESAQPLEEINPPQPDVNQDEDEARKQAEEQAAERAREQVFKEEQARLALEKKKKKDDDEKKKKLEAERKKKAEQEKKKKEEVELMKKQADEKRRREATQKLAEEKRKRSESDAQRKAEEDALAEQMEKDSQASAERQKFVKGEIDKFGSELTRLIQSRWNVPPDRPGNCRIRIQFGPGGMLLDVNDGVGDAELCRTVVGAVKQLRNVPWPIDPDVRDKVRITNLTMIPPYNQ